MTGQQSTEKANRNQILNGLTAFSRFLKSVPQCSRCLSDVLIEKSVLTTSKTVTRLTKRRKGDMHPLSIIPIPTVVDAGVQHESELRDAGLPPSTAELINNLIQVESSTQEENKETADAVKKLFEEVAGDDEEIGWAKLKKLLDSYLQKEFEFEGFSREVCRSMVAMVDLDRTGKLGLDEFTDLWSSILRWKTVFRNFDEDASGNLDSFELRKALSSAGYLVNNQVLKSLVLRYGDEAGNISFEDFIMCSVKLKALIEAFKEKDAAGNNEAKFTLAEWVEQTIYA